MAVVKDVEKKDEEEKNKPNVFIVVEVRNRTLKKHEFFTASIFTFHHRIHVLNHFD